MNIRSTTVVNEVLRPRINDVFVGDLPIFDFCFCAAIRKIARQDLGRPQKP